MTHLPIYRFFSPTAADLLVSRQMWLSRTSDFNDIFDVAPRHDSLAEKVWEREMKVRYCFLPPQIEASFSDYKKWMFEEIDKDEKLEEYLEVFKNDFDSQYGIICFCKESKCLLMWGHYTKSHSGFVVEFDLGHRFFNPKTFSEVNYDDSRPHVEAEDFRPIVLQKSKKWEYENEYRMILPLDDVSVKKGKRTEIDNNGERIPAPTTAKERPYVELPLESVKALYIGVKMPQREPKRLKELLDALKLPGREHIKCFWMRRHNSDYSIYPVPWDKTKPAP